MRDTDGFRHCDRCGAILTRENNKCGYEICDKCNEYLEDMGKNKPKRGHWIDIMVGDMPAQACDQCNTFYPLAYTGGGHKYCPNCGARMESGKQKVVKDMGLKEVCGNCEHYKRSYDGHCNAGFCCGNEDGENYGVPIFRDDTCDEWKEKDVGETNEIIKSL